MSHTTPGAYHTDMLSALMNETLDEAGAGQVEATPASLHREVSLLRGILDQANVWLDVLDSQGNVVLWNQAAEDISGYTQEEVVGHGQIWDWLYPDPAYRQEIIEQAAAIIDGEAVQDFETIIQTKDGEERIISWYSRDITSDEGEHIGSIALGRDITDRRRVEQALEESEQRYRTIVEHAHDWIWTLDRDGRLTFANRAVQQGTGYDFSEQDGAHFSSFIHPDDLPHIREIFEQTLSGKHSSYTVRILDSEGRTVHLEVSSAPRWQDDEIVGTIAFGRDVTEQVVLEDKLQESEERYRAMVEQSHDAVAIIQDEAFLFVNARLCEITGYSQETFDDLNVGDIIHPDDRARLEEMIHRRMRGETTEPTVQVTLRTERGAIRHGEFSVTPIFYGGQTAVLASIRDVTERRHIEQRLRESEQRLRDLLETTSDCIWEIDTEGKYTFVSGSVEAVLGYTPDELIGTSPFSLMPESEAQRMRQLFMEKATAREPLVDVENRNVSKNGNDVIMLTSAVPIIDDDGTLTGYRGIDKDVTEQKRAEAIARRQEKLSHLLLNATHDLGLLLDVDGTILTLNEAMAASLGVKREDVIQTDSRQYAQPGIFDPYIYADRMEKVREVQRTGQPVQFEDTRKGQWFDSRFYPIFDEDGDVIQIAIFVRDITEQKRMEQELKASEKRYRNLVEYSVYGFYVMDPTGRYTYINPAGEEITGYSPDEIREMRFSDLIIEEDLERAIQDFRAVAAGRPNEGTRRYRIRTKTGDIKTIEVNTIAIRENGSITSLYGTAVDITEREEA
ncbi:MAG: PAS domain S-box protein, partial [Thermoplasmatota archaeon]